MREIHLLSMWMANPKENIKKIIQLQVNNGILSTLSNKDIYLHLNGLFAESNECLLSV